MEKTATSEKTTTLKDYHLDTSVLIHDPQCPNVFQEHNVTLASCVLEELDTLKHRDREGLAMAARKAINAIDNLSPNGDNLMKGVVLSGGGMLRVDFEGGYAFNKDTADNRIVKAAQRAQERYDKAGEKRQVIVVSKDTNVRNKARALGIKAEDYKHDKTSEWREYGKIYNSPAEQRGETSVRYVRDEGKLYRYWGVDNRRPINLPPEIYGIRPKNDEQTCAADALLNPSISLCLFTGPAGTGKTIWPLACGLLMHEKKFYDQIIATKPFLPMGGNKDIGALPGEVLDKSWPWMRPLWDNLDVLISTPAEPKDVDIIQDRGPKKHHQSGKPMKKKRYTSIDYLIDNGIIHIEPLIYLRGASLPHRFFITSEAQSLRKDEIKTLITRAGEGTKMVIEGDLEQIDRFLDADSTGIAHVVREFLQDDDFCYLQLPKVERSSLAARAGARL